MKLQTLIAAALLAASGAALAFHCPADMKKIDDALAKGPKLTAEQMAEVKKYRAEGVEIWLAALNPEVLDLVRKTPLAERLGRSRMFFTVEDAVAAFEARDPAAKGGQSR